LLLAFVSAVFSVLNSPCFMATFYCLNGPGGPNKVIRRDLQTPAVKEEIRRYSSQYSARLSAHPNGLVVLMNTYQIPSVIVVFVVLVLRFSL
jgi:hypothetical protein